MKLLYITNGINGAGGLERVLSIKASYLADSYGYDVKILTLNDAHIDPFYVFSKNIKRQSIQVCGNPLKYIASYVNGIRKVVSEFNPDIIAVCDDGLKAFFTPLILGKKTPIIYERHASIKINTDKSIKGRISKFLMKQLAKSFSKFVVLTSSNVDEWRTGNIVVINNPVSFYPKESSLLSNNKVIVVGSHTFNKGYDLLLEAWKDVVQTHGGWKLEIYGKIDKEETYIKLAKKNGLEHSVYFHKPVLDIKNKYLDASIMVLPSRSEGFGMVLIEAMSCGLPCVSFDCPSGPRDIISNGSNGFLVPEKNVQGLSEKIKLLMDNELLRKSIGSNSKEYVKCYLPEPILKMWNELFISIVK